MLKWNDNLLSNEGIKVLDSVITGVIYGTVDISRTTVEQEHMIKTLILQDIEFSKMLVTELMGNIPNKEELEFNIVSNEIPTEESIQLTVEEYRNGEYQGEFLLMFEAIYADMKVEVTLIPVISEKLEYKLREDTLQLLQEVEDYIAEGLDDADKFIREKGLDTDEGGEINNKVGEQVKIINNNRDEVIMIVKEYLRDFLIDRNVLEKEKQSLLHDKEGRLVRLMESNEEFSELIMNLIVEGKVTEDRYYDIQAVKYNPTRENSVIVNIIEVINSNPREQIEVCIDAGDNYKAEVISLGNPQHSYRLTSRGSEILKELDIVLDILAKKEIAKR